MASNEDESGVAPVTEDLIQVAIEDVFDNWIQTNLGLNWDHLVASLTRHGVIRIDEDPIKGVQDAAVTHQLTEEQQFRVADGLERCIKYVLNGE